MTSHSKSTGLAAGAEMGRGITEKADIADTEHLVQDLPLATDQAPLYIESDARSPKGLLDACKSDQTLGVIDCKLLEAIAKRTGHSFPGERSVPL